MVRLENDHKSDRNNVIVTVYEESSKVRLPPSKNCKTRVTGAKSRQPFGYDRRAELLAHVHQLRNVDMNVDMQHVHPKVPSPIHPSPKPKKKTRFLAPLRKFRISRMFGERKKRWRYESIETQGYEYETKYKYCCPKKNSMNKFSKKFCRLLREYSCIWNCNKFSRNEQLQDLDSNMVDQKNSNKIAEYSSRYNPQQ